jgi:hypothetical protein
LPYPLSTGPNQPHPSSSPAARDAASGPSHRRAWPERLAPGKPAIPASTCSPTGGQPIGQHILFAGGGLRSVRAPLSPCFQSGLSPRWLHMEWSPTRGRAPALKNIQHYQQLGPPLIRTSGASSASASAELARTAESAAAHVPVSRHLRAQPCRGGWTKARYTDRPEEVGAGQPDVRNSQSRQKVVT